MPCPETLGGMWRKGHEMGLGGWVGMEGKGWDKVEEARFTGWVHWGVDLGEHREKLQLDPCGGNI